MSKVTRVAIGILLAVFLFLFTITTGLTGPIEAAMRLGLGWAFFVFRNLSTLRVNPEAVGTGLLVLAITAGLLHLCSRWLYRGLRQGEQRAGQAAWRTGWSAGLLLGFVLMFTASIGTAGVVHQLGWLLKSRQPIFVSRSLFGMSVDALRGVEAPEDVETLCSRFHQQAGFALSPEQAAQWLWKSREWVAHSDDVTVRVAARQDGKVAALLLAPREPGKHPWVNVCAADQIGLQPTKQTVPELLQHYAQMP